MNKIQIQKAEPQSQDDQQSPNMVKCQIKCACKHTVMKWQKTKEKYFKYNPEKR